jgi:hypothetical protein
MVCLFQATDGDKEPFTWQCQAIAVPSTSFSTNFITIRNLIGNGEEKDDLRVERKKKIKNSKSG